MAQAKEESSAALAQKQLKSILGFNVRIYETEAEVKAETPAESGTTPSKAAADGFPPTFTEKPRIVPNETGTLVTMKFKVD